MKSFHILPIGLRLSAVFRARVVVESPSSSSWSEGSEGGKGSILAAVSVSDADERLSGASPCGVPGTWLKKELLNIGGLLGLGTGAGIGLTSPVWMGGDCGRG